MRRLQFNLNKKSMFIWMGVLGFMIVGFMAFFPTMAEEGLQELMTGMPDDILQVLGFESFPDFSKIDQFFGYIIQYVMMALLVYSISLGLNTFLKEEKDGTIEFLYAQPITRTKLVLDKLMGNLMVIGSILLVVIGLSVITLVVFAPKGIEINSILIDSIPVFSFMILVTVLFLLLGTGLSLILPSTVSTVGVSMGVVFGPYVLGMMAQMVDALGSLEFISILHTTMPSRIYAGSFDYLSYGIWIGISLALFIYGLYYFKKRNIYV